ncbi:MAG: L-threonylcarbamoyladenylate synthase [Phormidesmis sp.]
MSRSLLASPTLISFPTDTVPALATLPKNAQLIYAAKQRSLKKPLILMGASFYDLSPYIKGNVAEMERWQAVCDRHWPGQLTLVLPASDLTPRNLNPLNAGSADTNTADANSLEANTIGIRVPSHPIALKLLAQTGPLATTSANLSGQPPLTTAADIARTFPTALTLAAELYTNASGQPSTVAKWSAAGWQVLRQGKIHL